MDLFPFHWSFTLTLFLWHFLVTAVQPISQDLWCLFFFIYFSAIRVCVLDLWASNPQSCCYWLQRISWNAHQRSHSCDVIITIRNSLSFPCASHRNESHSCKRGPLQKEGKRGSGCVAAPSERFIHPATQGWILSPFLNSEASWVVIFAPWVDSG